MNVLVVDDQMNVVNGICKGVNWEKVGIGEVFGACSAHEAKTVIRSRKVDILLCDIEMPGENGLELFRWVGQNGYSIKCIFLTAYADFNYAKMAISLGGFDYILQPARYQDIEKVLVRAIAQIREERNTERYSKYGRMLYEEKEALLDHLFYSWFREPQQAANTDKMTEAFLNLGIRIQAEEPLELMFIQIFGWRDGRWEDSLVRYSAKNILEELLCGHGKKILLNIIPDNGYLLLAYGGKPLEPKERREAIERFWSVCNAFFNWKGALYVREESRISGISRNLEQIRKYMESNVAHQEGIFYLDEEWDKRRKPQRREPDYDSWERLLEQGCGRHVYEEAVNYLDGVAGIFPDSAVILRRFYDNFMRISYLAQAKAKIPQEEIIGNEQIRDLSVHAYETVDAMKKLVQLMTMAFAREEENGSAVQRRIEYIKEYVYQNLDRDLRSDEIAMEVFVNPNYLSRMFKKETGISLKEFIVAEKMKMARMLLRSADLPISIVALKVGYTNFSHFSQVYRKYYGIRPTDEKKEKK